MVDRKSIAAMCLPVCHGDVSRNKHMHAAHRIGVGWTLYRALYHYLGMYI